MTDYWVSNPRKFCEICKCWFGDNQASISFHEQGRKHKDNVQRQLKQARNKSNEIERDNEKNAKTLAAIEQAAMKAYQKDVEAKYGGLPIADDAQRPLSEEELQLKKYQEIASSLKEEKERELEKQTIQQSIQKKVNELKQESAVASSWQQLVSPEGYTYYYNTVTGASQWEVPTDFQPAAQSSFTTNAVATSSSRPESTPALPSEDSSNSSTVAGQKRESNKDSTDDMPSTKRGRHQGPYGGWKTVAVYEVQEPDQTLDTQTAEVDDKESKEEQVKFEEKTLPAKGSSTIDEQTGGAEGGGGFKKFSFKKRAGTRPQIRNKTSELS